MNSAENRSSQEGKKRGNGVYARGFAATFRRRAPGGRLRRSSIGSGRGRAHGMVRGKRTVTVDDGLGRNFSIGDFYSYSIPKGSFME